MKICVGDLEANGFLNVATRIHCGVFKDIRTQEVVKFRPNEIREMLKFLDSVDVLIMHNGTGYDWPLLERLYGYVYKGKRIDTLLMSRLLDPNRQIPFDCPNKKAPHSVEAWGYRVGRGKPEHHEWGEFSEEMLHRCSEDVEIQVLIYKALLEEAAGGHWKNALSLTHKLFEILQKQEDYGWLVDKPHMLRCIALLDRWIERIDKALLPHLPYVCEVMEVKKGGEYGCLKKPFKLSGAFSDRTIKYTRICGGSLRLEDISGPFSRVSFRIVNLNSNDETKDFLLKAGWEPKEWNYNDEGIQTSPKLSKDDPFDGINGGVGRLVAKRVQCRQRKSIIEGLVGVIRDDGRIPSVINSIAVTGRATHRNIVNIPAAKSFFGKHMRKIFICKEGWTLVGTDSDACQIRMLCGRMNDPEYTKVVLEGKKEDGTDIHSANMRAAGLPDRDSAKSFFYSFLFGAGDAKVGKIVKGNADRGRKLKEDFLKGLPALGDLVERLTKEWRATAKRRYNAKFNRMEYYNGTITGLDGRPIVVPSEHQILVYLLQSDEAIMMSCAYCRFYQQMSKAGYVWGKDYGIVCWYHDEFTVECRKEISKHVAVLAEKTIAWAGKFYNISCPHLGQAKIGENWYVIH